MKNRLSAKDSAVLERLMAAERTLHPAIAATAISAKALGNQVNLLGTDGAVRIVRELLTENIGLA